MTVPTGLEIATAPSRSAFQPELDAIESRLADASGLQLHPLTSLLELMFKRGGKRIRPSLVIASTRLGSCTEESVADLGAAVETLHAATLVHDDLVDGSAIRRGLPTINTRWSAGATVLAGDWLFARAARFAAATGSVRVMDIFARTLQTLTDGELRQLLGRSEVPSLDEYEGRIYSKTAALFEAACEMGGVLADQTEPRIQALAAYGRELGMAFQIVDDILDYDGNADRMGKPVGSDLRNGTLTLPVLLHLERAGTTWSAKDGPEAADALAAAVAADSNALDGARAAAQSRADAAVRSLETLPDGNARDLLAGIALTAIQRDA